jgi:hypothetical protein
MVLKPEQDSRGNCKDDASSLCFWRCRMHSAARVLLDQMLADAPSPKMSALKETS